MNETDVLDFFESGFYEDYWGWEFDEGEAGETAMKSMALLGAKGGHLLDWCGGWGRISIHLAGMGFRVTILDFTQKYLERAKTDFRKRRLEVTTVCVDCRNTPSDIRADYALCSFNSIGFLSDDEQVAAFKSLAGALKKGGKVVIDCINQLFLARYLQPAMKKTRPDGIQCVQRNVLDPLTSVLHSEFRIEGDKDAAARRFSQRMYTPLELRIILESAGFSIEHMYGDFDGNAVSLDLPQIVAVART
ncbi:MAG: methyltransferase domain-containing protein [Spirochaetales bacterium]|nr:methyltransferase domain-containing protein [Spirochaetales bacterium]